MQMGYASQVIIVPGYGMAVPRPSMPCGDGQPARGSGVEVRYAIHPVAGRMPGHMNVLLAEADVPYEQLKEMDEINGEFGRTDVALVIGANDVTNPAARTIPTSPIYGMPILNVDQSRSVIVLKRSMARATPASKTHCSSPTDLDALRRRQEVRRADHRGTQGAVSTGAGQSVPGGSVTTGPIPGSTKVYRLSSPTCRAGGCRFGGWIRPTGSTWISMTRRGRTPMPIT